MPLNPSSKAKIFFYTILERTIIALLIFPDILIYSIEHRQILFLSPIMPVTYSDSPLSGTWFLYSELVNDFLFNVFEYLKDVIKIFPVNSLLKVHILENFRSN